MLSVPLRFLHPCTHGMVPYTHGMVPWNHEDGPIWDGPCYMELPFNMYKIKYIRIYPEIVGFKIYWNPSSMTFGLQNRKILFSR